MAIDNDTRGWIMTCISGIACVLGASVICIDVIVRLFPHMQNFKISESDAFLSASLSLSFGVMLFSSLYSMLPQSKTYLEDGGYTPRDASYLLIGLFLGGVGGIRLLSSLMHRFIPSHIVDCDHNHDEESTTKQQEEMLEHEPDDEHTNGIPIQSDCTEFAEEENEETPLLSRTASISQPSTNLRQSSAPPARKLSNKASLDDGFVTAPTSRRPSLMPRFLTRTLTRYVAGKKDSCDENGPCMGFGHPCGKDCFKAVQRRTSTFPAHPVSRAPTFRTQSMGGRWQVQVEEAENHLNTNGHLDNDVLDTRKSDSAQDTHNHDHHGRSRQSTRGHHNDREHSETLQKPRRGSPHSHSVGAEHHHHVPTNAFMAIGLQTSIAIALHKAPEGFITYATNHANPTLGFAVFMALFIHNITEGFAMSLPLYLALESRFKAIVWSSILGGLSQPLGAGVAALWFKLAKRSESGGPSEGVYGGMFAVTAGVMASVALSLFSESLQLSHNKGTCIAFAFLGMAILGVSFALTAK